MGILVLILIGIVTALVASAYLCKIGNENCCDVVSGISAGGFVLTGITAIAFCFASWDYVASGYKANIINREHGTSYTREEVYFAPDVVEWLVKEEAE